MHLIVSSASNGKWAWSRSLKGDKAIEKWWTLNEFIKAENWLILPAASQQCRILPVIGVLSRSFNSRNLRKSKGWFRSSRQKSIDWEGTAYWNFEQSRDLLRFHAMDRLFASSRSLPSFALTFTYLSYQKRIRTAQHKNYYNATSARKSLPTRYQSSFDKKNVS